MSGTSKKSLLAIVFTPLLLLVTLLGIQACSRTREFTPEWLLIKWFNGEIIKGSRSEAKVYVAQYLSTTGQPITFLQNRFVVNMDGKVIEYRWPDNITYAAGWCEILDLDNDGSKEFLIGSDRIVRIVRFDGKSFVFRTDKDEISSINHDIGPFDLNRDGKLEFIVDKPLHSGRAEVSIPYVYVWSSVKGFSDVSAKFANYYNRVVIPDLERRLQMAKTQEEGSSIKDAMSYVQSLPEIKKKTGSAAY